MLLAAWDGPALDRLVAIGTRLAALGRHELLVTRVVPREELLADAVAATRSRGDDLRRAGVTCRAAALSPVPPEPTRRGWR